MSLRQARDPVRVPFPALLRASTSEVEVLRFIAYCGRASCYADPKVPSREQIRHSTDSGNSLRGLELADPPRGLARE